jgi:group II intron reverse transcriptase/maturase
MRRFFSMTVKTIESYTDEWKRLPWKKFQKNLFKLQHRIYKAAKANDIENIKKLQSLLVGSKCGKYLAVRQVTQINVGKPIAGVDGLSKLNPKKRMHLVADLGQLNDWKHDKLKRVYIPKDDGTQTPLGIPTIRDRAAQCLIKYALEPVYEARASEGNFGFRPGPWDIQKAMFYNLNSSKNGYRKTIVEMDISKCFDNINYDKLMSLIILPAGLKKALRSALKAGVLTEREKTEKQLFFRNSTDFDFISGQGGVISPLLANIALHGVENLQNERVSSTKSMPTGFRYADDMVFILKEGEDPNKLLDKISGFLKERGLNINQTKSKIVPTTKGFDFLGWHFLVKPKNYKFVSFPSQKNHNAMKNKIKKTVKDTRYALKDRLKMVKTIYGGWLNYHRYCHMSQINLRSLHDWVYKYLKKSTKMPLSEIIETVRGIFTGHNQAINRFIASKGSRSVYDNDWLYWAKRNNKPFAS